MLKGIVLGPAGQILGRVTRLQAQWQLLLPLLLPAECKVGDEIDYHVFLNNFQVHYGTWGDVVCSSLGKGPRFSLILIHHTLAWQALPKQKELPGPERLSSMPST